MRTTYITLFLLAALTLTAQKTTKTENIILVTFDGYRWQELFDGAQKKLFTKKQVLNADDLKERFWAESGEDRRKKLMPFFWNTLAKEGVILEIGRAHV